MALTINDRVKIMKEKKSRRECTYTPSTIAEIQWNVEQSLQTRVKTTLQNDELQCVCIILWHGSSNAWHIIDFLILSRFVYSSN